MYFYGIDHVSLPWAPGRDHHLIKNLSSIPSNSPVNRMVSQNLRDIFRPNNSNYHCANTCLPFLILSYFAGQPPISLHHTVRSRLRRSMFRIGTRLRGWCSLVMATHYCVYCFSSPCGGGSSTGLLWAGLQKKVKNPVRQSVITFYRPMTKWRNDIAIFMESFQATFTY